jgi:hypothetical protein
MSLRYMWENTEPHFSRKRGIPISQLRAHGGARGQVPPKPLPFETLHEGSAISFLESVYATAQTAAVVHRHLPRTLHHRHSSSLSSSRGRTSSSRRRDHLYPLWHDEGGWTRIRILGAHGRVWSVHLPAILRFPDHVCFSYISMLF